MLEINNSEGYFKILYNNWESNLCIPNIEINTLQANLEKNTNIGKIEITKIENMKYVIHFMDKASITVIKSNGL